ncbi:bifunctional DNA primase/polymerase [Streptomyces sp. t39]|uniref:bifunctional DNA primase/polymerase n=1 Tax=Streptomyces sp. t39 TaxID=1828156 RepID=UPI0021C5877D|nr:bifunctional DNA primase/polymerase [Streptomyces sp. t39]
MAITDRQTATLALAHALSAAERGLPVIPLSANKLPALRSPHRGEPEPFACRGECGRPGHGVHDATRDPAAVRALFAAAPWATGYGIACGRPPHRLIGIDLDVKAETDATAELRHLALEHLFTVPETVTVLTPSGGRHLWLTGPPGVTVPNSASRLAPGIDVRGAGGYLVGPGSVTAQGAYRLAPGTAGLPPAPFPEEETWPATVPSVPPAAPRPFPPSLLRTHVRKWFHGHHRPADRHPGPRPRALGSRARAPRHPAVREQAPGPALPPPGRAGSRSWGRSPRAGRSARGGGRRSG